LSLFISPIFLNGFVNHSAQHVFPCKSSFISSLDSVVFLRSQSVLYFVVLKCLELIVDKNFKVKMRGIYENRVALLNE
jgi:hypothetical protein